MSSCELVGGAEPRTPSRGGSDQYPRKVDPTTALKRVSRGPELEGSGPVTHLGSAFLYEDKKDPGCPGHRTGGIVPVLTL